MTRLHRQPLNGRAVRNLVMVGAFDGEPLVESVWVEPSSERELGLADGLAAPEARYEQRESVELAFVAALQRASLILIDVLGFSAREVAASLDTKVASVNSALQPARRGVDERVPRAEPGGDAALARRRGPAPAGRAVHRAWDPVGCTYPSAVMQSWRPVGTKHQ